MVAARPDFTTAVAATSQRNPARLAALAEAWDEAGVWEGNTQAGGISPSASAAGMFALDEVLVHGWGLHLWTLAGLVVRAARVLL